MRRWLLAGLLAAALWLAGEGGAGGPDGGAVEGLGESGGESGCGGLVEGDFELDRVALGGRSGLGRHPPSGTLLPALTALPGEDLLLESWAVMCIISSGGVGDGLKADFGGRRFVSGRLIQGVYNTDMSGMEAQPEPAERRK